MALGTSRIAALSGSSGLAAAATARPMSGGRGVAASAQAAVESSNFSSQIGVNDNAILHYDDQGGLNADGQRRETQQNFSTYYGRAPVSDTGGLDQNAGGGTLSRVDIQNGIGQYEFAARLAVPGTPRPGARINYRF